MSKMSLASANHLLKLLLAEIDKLLEVVEEKIPSIEQLYEKYKENSGLLLYKDNSYAIYVGSSKRISIHFNLYENTLKIIYDRKYKKISNVILEGRYRRTEIFDKSKIDVGFWIDNVTLYQDGYTELPHYPFHIKYRILPPTINLINHYSNDFKNIEERIIYLKSIYNDINRHKKTKTYVNDIPVIAYTIRLTEIK